MKSRRAMVGLLVAAMMTGVAAPAFAAQSVGQDTVVDRVTDWFATMGKSGSEKNSIIAQRRMARATKRTERAVSREADKAGKQVEGAGRDVKKGLKDLTN